MTSPDHRTCRRLWPASCALLFVVSLVGCGSSKYDERLERTAHFYSYVQELDRNLAPQVWQQQDLGLAYRVPQPFVGPLLQTPELRKKNLPQKILGVELPGVLEAWSASTTGKGEPDAYIYLLSNHDRFLSDNPNAPQPAAFIKDLETRLATIFKVKIPETEAPQPQTNSRFRVQAPPPNHPHAQYTTPKEYIGVWYLPTSPIKGQTLEGRLFTRREGDIQVALLVLSPQSTTAQFRQRLDLALESLHFTDTRPQRKSAPASPAPTGPQQGPSRANF